MRALHLALICYDFSYYASTVFPGRTILATRPMKRQRLMAPQQVRQNLAAVAAAAAANARAHSVQQQQQQQIFLPANVITNCNGSPMFQMDLSNGDARSNSCIDSPPTNGTQLQQNSIGALKVYSKLANNRSIYLCYHLSFPSFSPIFHRRYPRHLDMRQL